MNDLSRLPGDPVGFFSLQEPYDRRDLKRAYGKAIRQYKPETHPAEFQLIRDAYERLEKSLRYGRQQQDQANTATAWSFDSPPSEPDDSANGSSAATFQPAHSSGQPQARRRPVSTDQLNVRQLAMVDAASAQKKLLAQTRLSPQDYYLAAVLADAIDSEPTSQYLGHLMDGLTVHPHDPGLVTLATEYLRTEIPDAMIAKTLSFVANKVRTSLVYMLTETLWVRLSALASFAEIEKLLAQCEQSIHQTDLAARTTFYLRILRSLIWKAPAEWSARILNDVESQSANLDYTEQFELEFLSELHALLHGESDSSRFNDPVRKKIIDALQLACRDEDAASALALVDKLSEIARDASGMQSAFPVHASEDQTLWVLLGYKLVHHVQSFADDITQDEVPTQRIVTQTVHLVSDLETTAAKLVNAINGKHWWYKTIPLIAWMTGGVFFGSMIIIAPIASTRASATVAWGCTVIFVALIVGFFIAFNRWIFPRFLAPAMQKRQRSHSLSLYVKHWRGRGFRFAQSNPETLGVHTARIEAVCEKTGRRDLGNTINYFIQQDAGLSLFAALQTVLR